MQLALTNDDRAHRTISPYQELGAYEAMWKEAKASFKTLAERFAEDPGALPSDFVSASEAEQTAEQVYDKLKSSAKFGVRVHGAAEYPNKLRDARYPVELLYYQGWWDLINSKSVAVVGTRKPSPEGVARTRKLVRSLVEDDYTIVSGLAAGVDTAAHTAALESKGRTYAVIGTPLSHTYPKENVQLQQKLSNEYLVVSQVPVLKYESQDYRWNRAFFPERNKTMSALTLATVIVEAGETSGTLIQARAALEQGRELFILDNCFRNSKLTWPAKYEKKGAIRVRDYSDIRSALSK